MTKEDVAVLESVGLRAPIGLWEHLRFFRLGRCRLCGHYGVLITQNALHNRCFVEAIPALHNKASAD